MADRPTDHARAEAAFAEFRRNGSPRAMAEVFDRTAAGLLLVARRFARDAAEAEDLVQQTFLRAIERAATFTADRQLMPWLTAILANEARMELRRRRTPDPDRLPHATSEEPSHAAERREAAAAMHAAFAQLPPAYRDVLALRYLHDTRPGRIATALALPLPTVKTRLNRGVRKLAASLPRGLAFGAAVALCAGRGLPATRRAVTRYAGASTASAWTLTGLLAMKKTVLPVAIGVLLLAALWLLSPFGPGSLPVAAPGTQRGDAVAKTHGALPASDQQVIGDAAAAPSRTAVEVPAPERKGRVHAIEVHALWRGTAQPAAGIPFTLLVQANDWLARAVTNDAGTAMFDLDRIDGLEHRARGSVSIMCAFGPGRYHTVELDEVTDSPRVVEVEVDDGRQVAGIVVNDGGVPVAGAAIWLTFDRFAPASLAQHTDAAGHFLLRGLSPEFSIRATHDGMASADLVAANLEGEGEVVLRLATAAARLRVLVTDATGGLLAGSAVHLDDRNRSANRRHFTTTGSDGRASLDGIAPGKYQLEVVHPSFPPAQQDILIANASEERQETVKLGAAADLDGRVRLANGDAVAGAWVSVGHDVSSMLWRDAHTDGDGRFRFRGLAVGRHYLWITRAVPDIRRVIELRVGQQELEITAPGSRRIVGQLVDAEGRPLPGWNVRAQPVSDFRSIAASTTAEGRFAFDGLTESPYLLEVGQDHRALATFVDVRTDGRDSVYRLPANTLPRAFLVGRIEGAPDCTLIVSRRIKMGEQNTHHLPVPADGHFEFGPMPPVAYDIGLQLSGASRTWWFATADLAATDRCDLGTIRMPQPGRLEVTVRDDLGCKKLSVGVRPVDLGGSGTQALERIDRDHWRATDLPPGEYDVCLFDEATAPVTQRITVESSRAISIALATAPGALVAYRLVPPAGTPWEAIGWQMLTVRATDGRLVSDHKLMGPLDHSKRLLEGSYTFEVATGGGFRGSATVVVPQPDGAEVQIPITR